MSFKTLFALSLAVVMLPVWVSAQTTPASPTTPVTQLQNLAHTVDSLDKTVPFYRDTIGLPVNGARDPLTQQAQALDEDLSRFTATKGAKFRAATFRIPNAAFGFELTEFTGVPRKSVQPRLQDIGTATLVVQVRDMDKMVARLKATNTVIVTAGGAPVNPSGNQTSKMRELLVRDPDGFFVELQQPDPLPASAATTTGDVLGGSVQLSIEDSSKTVAFMREAIGFVARPTGALATNPVVANLINLPGAQWRITHGSIPGTTLDFGLIEYVGVPRAAFSLGAEDPGSPAFTMVVRDIDAAVAQWKKAGGTVVSIGGQAITRANGSGNVFVRDVNGFMWELIQRAAP
jgi:catechol 2,3-dioxygenase-like lactoylglutathione lyase family enzyme